MHRFVSAVLFVILAFSLVPQRAMPQDKPAAAPAVTGVRGEFLAELSYYEGRFTRLAEAMPAEKYSWRPMEGVRSVGDVYAHIAAANYRFANLLGTSIPAGVDPKAIEGMAGDKAKVVQALKDSFAHMREAVLAIKDADLENAVKTPRGPTTIRGAFILLSGHLGEHLGQSIAYARQNGIVPPWTEERLKQEAQKPKS